MKFGKKIYVVLLAMIAMFLLNGCYWRKEVQANQIGIHLSDGISFSGTYGPGRYSDGGWFADLRRVDVSVITVDWEDPSLVTKDKQPIGLKLSLSFRRSGLTDDISSAFSKYNSELFDNNRLVNLVFSRVPDVVKEATAQLTLDQMLFERSQLASTIREPLKLELIDVYVELVSVNITDIAVDPDYEAKLKEKARVIQDREIAQESVRTAEENLKRTQAETEIQLELARRENLVNQELARVYELNDRFFELKRLELLRNVFGENDKIIFVPQGSDLSVITMQDNGESVTPVVVPQP